MMALSWDRYPMRANSSTLQVPSPRTPPPSRLAVIVAMVGAALVTPSAHALQLIEASDGVSVEAILSIKEPTRIRIEGAPITDVFGNIYSSHCAASPTLATLPAMPVGTPPSSPSTAASNTTGDVVLECDRDKGEIYIRPTGVQRHQLAAPPTKHQGRCAGAAPLRDQRRHVDVYASEFRLQLFAEGAIRVAEHGKLALPVAPHGLDGVIQRQLVERERRVGRANGLAG